MQTRAPPDPRSPAELHRRLPWRGRLHADRPLYRVQEPAGRAAGGQPHAHDRQARAGPRGPRAIIDNQQSAVARGWPPPPCTQSQSFALPRPPYSFALEWLNDYTNLSALKKFVKYANSQPDVYFVTTTDVVRWMQVRTWVRTWGGAEKSWETGGAAHTSVQCYFISLSVLDGGAGHLITSLPRRTPRPWTRLAPS